MKITPDAVEEIIDYYTREAGVRNLEREYCRTVPQGLQSCWKLPTSST